MARISFQPPDFRGVTGRNRQRPASTLPMTEWQRRQRQRSEMFPRQRRAEAGVLHSDFHGNRPANQS